MMRFGAMGEWTLRMMGRCGVRWLVWVAFLWAGARLWSWEALPPLAMEYVVTVFGAEHGLPVLSVSSVAHLEAEGTVWIGTFDRLWLHDEAGFVNQTTELTGRDAPSGVRRLMADGFGRLWASVVGGVGERRDGRWRVHALGGGRTNDLVASMAMGKDGRLWLVTDRDLLRSREDGFDVVAPPEPILEGEKLELVVEGERLWWLSRRGLWSWDEAGWTRVASEEPEGAGWMAGMGRAQGGGLWVAFDREVRLMRDGRWLRRMERPERMRNDVVRVLEDGRGNVWLGGWQKGLAVFAPDGRVRTFQREEGLPNDSISSLCEDREGNIWAGSNGGGLVRFRPLAVRLLGLESGIRHPVNHLVEARPGELLLATHGEGVLTLRDGVVHPDPEWLPGVEGGPKYPWITLVYQDRAGRVWGGLSDTGMGERRPDGWHPVPSEQVGARRIMAFLEDRSGRFWVGTVAGLAVGESGRFRPLGPEVGGPRAVVVSLAEDGAGHVWAAGKHWGLFRGSGESFENYRVPGMPTNAVFGGVLAARDGGVWVAAGKAGLAWIRKGKTTLIQEAQGLPRINFVGVLEDDRGDLWAASEDRLVRVSRESLDAVAAGQRGRVDTRVLEARDGLPPLLSQAWWRGLLKASDGRLWLATQRGLAVVDPARLPPPVPPPRTRITMVQGPGGRDVDRRAGKPITVSYDQRQLDVGHHARVLGTPERVRYESRLLPGGDWRDIGTSRKTLLRDMRSGSYQLEVRATLNGLEWGETASLPFVVRPPFWETGWFFSCVALAGTGLVFVGVRGVLRLRYKKRIAALERVAALDQERARIARDLHDDLGSTMTQISLSLERAVRDAAATGMRVEAFRDGLEATRRGMASLSATVWALHPSGDQLPDLCTQVADQASRFLRRSGVSCVIDIPEGIPAKAVSAESRHHLVLIVREVLNNLVRHAHARRAWIQIRFPAEGLVLEVRDDGRGFDPALVRNGGHGLSNLRERASAMGATLQIDARPGQGTRVSLALPWTKVG